MTVYATLLDGSADASRRARREFPGQRAATDWFARYVHARTEVPDPNPYALLELYDSPVFGRRGTTLRATRNPDRTYRIVDRARGDRIHRGYLVSGIDLCEAEAGYLTAQLRAAHLHEDFGVPDIPTAYRATVLLGVRFIAGAHPLATRMWLQHHNSREFGHRLYQEHTDSGGFRSRGNGTLDQVEGRLHAHARCFALQPLHRRGSRLHHGSK